MVLLNDLYFLDFVKLFVDGTDALVRASRNYKITQKDLNALIQVKKWNLLHKNTPQSINRTIKGLKEKFEIYKNDEEICKLINLALKRIIHEYIKKISIYNCFEYFIRKDSSQTFCK